MTRKYKTEQVYYSDWNDKLAPGHEDYWNKISIIAEWIGYALEASISGYSPMWNHLATITVQQTKEKFGQARVYTNLATHEHVEQQWKEDLTDAKEKNNRYHRWVSGDLDEENHKEITPHILSSFKYNTYPLDEPTLEEHEQQCREYDSAHYRHVYQQAFTLWPEYEYAIWSGADHPNYLFNDIEELEEYYAKQVDDINESSYLTDDDKVVATTRYEEEKAYAMTVCRFGDQKDV